MAKSNKKIDTCQLSLFDLLRSYREQQPEKKPAGSFDIDKRFREEISEALKRCPRSRWEVAARMSELVGADITKSMLDSWTSEAKETHRFPSVYLPAFCEAAGDTAPLKMLGSLVGVFILPGPEALRAEIRRLEEEIEGKQPEKRKRLIFLKEMEGKR